MQKLIKEINDDGIIQEKIFPEFHPVTFTGDYNSLTNKPVTSGFSGDYNDLTNKPALFDGNYTSLTNTPVLFDGDYNKLTNKPVVTLPKVETISGISHGVVSSNKNNTLKLTNIGDVVITVAKDLAFLDTELVYFINISAKSVRFTPATGVIIRSEDGALKMAKQNTIVALTKIGVNEYLLTGNLIK